MPSPIALVTGATLGSGRVTAFALRRAGYKVGVCAHTANVSNPADVQVSRALVSEIDLRPANP